MDSLKLDKMMNGFIKIIYNKLPGVFRPEGPGYFSPGQSLRRNDGNIAPGEKCVLKTVREEKSTQGNALGYNNFPFQGIERMESDIRKIYFELKRE